MRLFRGPRTVRTQLLLAALLVEGVMLTLLVTNSVRLLYSSLTEQARLHAEQVTPVLNAALVAPLAQMDTATVQAILKESHAVNGIDYLAVEDRRGRVVAASGWKADVPLPVPDENFTLADKGGGARYDVRVPIRLAGQELGRLQIGLSLKHIVAARRALVVQGVAIALGELVLSAGLLALVGWWLTRRLTRLMEAAAAVAKDDFSQVRAEEGDDDVGRLGSAFNTMADAVNQRVAELKAALDERACVASILDQERARLLALLSAMEFGVLFADGNGRVVYANPAFTRFWQLDGDPIGRPVEDVVPVADLLAAGEAELSNGRIVTCGSFPVTVNDGSGGTLWTFADVTAPRLFARELLAAKDAAEAANTAKATFLATMSHEIRTPMNGVIGMAGLLLDTALDRNQRRFANAIRTSSEALLVILNDILDFSKMEAGKLIFEEHAFEIRSLVEGVVDVLAPRLSGRSIEMECSIGADCDGLFLSDSGRLRQVVLNLAGNALKFTERGRVDISATVEEDESGENWLRITVADTGIGIPREAQQRVFQSFSQADASTSRRFGGTGLGLAISSRIVEMMGGEIHCISEEGVGSTFWFRVPVVRSAERRCNSRDVQLPPGVRILAVSEDPNFLDQVLPMLERLGIEAIQLPEATAALARLRRDAADHRPPPVLLLDDTLVGVTGADLVLLTRADPSLRSIMPVMVLSPDAAHAPLDQDGRLGGVPVLRGPAAAGSLYQLLVELYGTVPAGSPEPLGLGEGMRVLVAEDNPINQQVAVGLLQKFGHRADVADDGIAAVAMVKKCSYDLVLMDMQMPGMSGLDATRAIRALPGEAGAVPIIAMTANAMRGDRDLCLSAGMDDYISKPIDRAKLGAILERWQQRLAQAV